MMKNNSIISAEKPHLENNSADRAAIFVKGVVGIAPFVGPLLSEIVTSHIPNQKMERLVLFTQLLEQKIKHIETDILDAKMKTEEMSDLLEDALRQASRALTPERREYIANALKNSLEDDALDHIVKKRLFALLEQVDDVDIIRLKTYLYPMDGSGAREAFFEKHSNVLETFKYPDGTQAAEDRHAVFENPVERLMSFNLYPQQGGGLTPLAIALLRFIDQGKH